MTKIEKSVLIGVPIEKVYGFARDWRNLRRYYLYVREVTPVTEKTVGPGARLLLRVKFLGRVMKSEWEGVEEAENVGWTFKAKLMGVTAVKRWRFAREDGATRVTFTLEYSLSPPVIGNLLDVLLIRPRWRSIYEESFSKLKSLLESGEAALAPGA